MIRSKLLQGIRSHSPCFHPSPFPALSATRRSSLRIRLCADIELLRRVGMALLLMIGSTHARAEPTSSPPKYVAGASDPVASFVAEAAQRFDIPTQWIRAVMRVESAGNARAVSPKGAVGLMQIMPDTWANLRLGYGLGDDPFDPRDNILAGAAYLRELHDRYGATGFLAAYNAGPARYEDHLATGLPLPVETQNYVAILTHMLVEGPADRTIKATTFARPWISAPLFASTNLSGGAAAQAATSVPVNDQSNATATPDLMALAPQLNGLFVPISVRIEHP